MSMSTTSYTFSDASSIAVVGLVDVGVHRFEQRFGEAKDRRVVVDHQHAAGGRLGAEFTGVDRFEEADADVVDTVCDIDATDNLRGHVMPRAVHRDELHDALGSRVDERTVEKPHAGIADIAGRHQVGGRRTAALRLEMDDAAFDVVLVAGRLAAIALAVRDRVVELLHQLFNSRVVEADRSHKIGGFGQFPPLGPVRDIGCDGSRHSIGADFGALTKRSLFWLFGRSGTRD